MILQPNNLGTTYLIVHSDITKHISALRLHPDVHVLVLTQVLLLVVVEGHLLHLLILRTLPIEFKVSDGSQHHVRTEKDGAHGKAIRSDVWIEPQLIFVPGTSAYLRLPNLEFVDAHVIGAVGLSQVGRESS